MSETKMNFNNHYHLGERNTTSINIMSGIKSLVCDFQGIIIAEMVYRCMICDVIYDTIPEVQIHYQTKHIDPDIQSCTSGTHTNCSANCSVTSKSENPTNISFFGSFQSATDSYLDSISTDFSTPQTLTFDVPSGLKTLQQQFESSAKVVPSGGQQKKKTNKPFTSGNSKTKTGFSHKSKVFGQTTGSPIKSGFITCEICGATKFYKYTQRRFGVYSCVGCAKFYSKYLLKPVNYMCENLGKCNLKVSECEPNGRCKACLIHKCKSKFIIDSKKLTNYNKMPSILSQNETKTKTNSKSMSKTKTSNQLSVETKLKSGLTSPKTKTETDGSSLHKTNSSLALNKKLKSDKTNQKNMNEKNEIQNKKSPNTSTSNKSQEKTVSPRLKRNSLKSNDMKPMEKRTRSQSTCRKCFGCKDKNCINCCNDLKTKIVVKNNMRPKLLKRTYCLTRNRNK